MTQNGFYSYVPLISALLIIVGWFVIYGNAKRLASRSETFTIINRISEMLRDLEKNGITYWHESSPAEQHESRLFIGLCKSNLQSILDLNDVLTSRGVSGLCKSSLHDLEDSLTLDCEYRASSQIETEKVTRERVRNIQSITSKLNTELLSQFGRSYSPT